MCSRRGKSAFVAASAFVVLGGIAGGSAIELVLSNSSVPPRPHDAFLLEEFRVPKVQEVSSSAEWQQHLALADVAEQRARPRPALLAPLPAARPITARPGGGREIGVMPAGSPWFNVPTVAWVLERSREGRYGKVVVPYEATSATGWIRIGDLKLSRTPYAVRVDLSQRLVKVTRRGRTTMRFPAGIGAPGSPTPPGRYFVTDRIPFSAGSPFGTFAFGLSGIQPQLPPGWNGGTQLAIHGTNDPSSIGGAIGAGCLRVSQRALERMMPLLRLGTPVVIRR